MIEQLTALAIGSFNTLAEAARALAVPALFFLCLGLLVKGTKLIADMRRAAGEASLNLQIMAFNLLLVVPLISLVSDGIAALFARYDLVLFQPGFWEAIPAALTIVVAVFIGDFVGYWRHRLEHTRWLWPAHAVHHSDTQMTWLALERFHPINRVTTFVIDTAVLLLLGLPPFAVVANNLVRHYYGYLIHADLPWTYGRLGQVFVSPAMHRWHHAADSRFFGTNYATVFSLFDRAFGTFRVPGPCDAALGVTGDMAPTLLGQMMPAFSPATYAGLLPRRRRRQPAPLAPAPQDR